jgi:uncharacterized membrane protein
MMINAKKIAFIAIMCAIANILGFISIPIGLTSIHIMQLPIILSSLSFGSWTGGLVGFIGAMVMAYRLTPPNPYILLGNAILGLLIGFFYSNFKKLKTKPIIPQIISVLIAFIIQAPYVYITDVYLMTIPSQVVLTIILPKLLLEDIISVFIAHIILFNIDITQNIS